MVGMGAETPLPHVAKVEESCAPGSGFRLCHSTPEGQSAEVIDFF